MASIGARTRTPMPDRETEMRSSGSGPVTSYTLSPEELAKYGPAKPYVGPEKKPMQHRVAAKVDLSSEEQRRRALVGHQNREEQNEMTNKLSKEAPSCGLTKKIYIEQIAAGETNASIERAWGMKANSLYQWLTKWELKGLNTDKAQQLMEAPAPPDQPPMPPGPADNPPIKPVPAQTSFDEAAAQILAAEVELSRQKDTEIERLTARMIDAQKEATKAWSEVEGLRKKLDEAEQLALEISLNSGDSITRITEENNHLKAELEEAQVAIQDLVTVQPVQYESVDGPPANLLEMMTPEMFEGFCIGNVLENVRLYRLNNGVKDLQKAANYLRWIIDKAQ
jgi:hypothetical protein